MNKETKNDNLNKFIENQIKKLEDSLISEDNLEIKKLIKKEVNFLEKKLKISEDNNKKLNLEVKNLTKKLKLIESRLDNMTIIINNLINKFNDRRK